MKYYTIINVSDDYVDMGFKCKTLKEAKECIKKLKKFDEKQGNPFTEEYIIEKIEY